MIAFVSHAAEGASVVSAVRLDSARQGPQIAFASALEMSSALMCAYWGQRLAPRATFPHEPRGEWLGGLMGCICIGWIHVNLLSVSETPRGQRYGTHWVD